MSKLQAERALRMLTDLMQVPGNDVCADCKSPAPRWASYNLGIFICVHCASIHRKLGTHISKVKSINMDVWTKEQIDSIKTTGNKNSNAIYNPTNVDPPVNLHDSERDSELEKFIRNKYQYKRFMNLGNDSISRGSTSRIEEGRTKAREMLNVAAPERTSTSPQPRKASPALTTKSPAVSPAPPTPSPSLPAPVAAAQAPIKIEHAPSPQPPLQMLAQPSQPPLQILTPEANLALQSMQTGMQAAYQPLMYTGVGMAPVPIQSLPNGNPVWQDMAALQSGPAMPVYQTQPLVPTMAYNMTGAVPTPTGYPVQAAGVPWTNTGAMPMQAPLVPSYTAGMPLQYAQTGYTPIQPQFQQQQPQVQQPQPQTLYVQNGVIMQQPSPLQSSNTMLWNQMQTGMYGMGP